MHTVTRRSAPLFSVVACLIVAAAFAPTPAHALTEAQQDAAIQQLQNAVASLQSTVSSLQSTVNSQQATINKQASRIMQLSGAVSGTQNKLKYVKVSGTDFTFTGCNVHIVNGLGATNGNPNYPYGPAGSAVNGLGNLVIGYNETRANDTNNPGMDTRTGSHCLILGEEANYSSYGGIVAGDYNTVSAPYASVTGGYDNTASDDFSSVSGGTNNIASGYASAACGGQNNQAADFYSSVTGGLFNTAAYRYAAVNGGEYNTADGPDSSVGGGYGNVSGGLCSSVSGGAYVQDNYAYGFSAGGSYSQSSPGPGVFHSP